MLLPEARLEVLVEQLGSLPRGDRKAIMARLSRPEREQLRARIASASARPTSPYSSDIAHRLEALTGDGALPVTAAGRTALAKAVQASRAAAPAQPARSLFEAVLSAFQAGARR